LYVRKFYVHKERLNNLFAICKKPLHIFRVQVIIKHRRNENNV